MIEEKVKVLKASHCVLNFSKLLLHRSLDRKQSEMNFVRLSWRPHLGEVWQEGERKRLTDNLTNCYENREEGEPRSNVSISRLPTGEGLKKLLI